MDPIKELIEFIHTPSDLRIHRLDHHETGELTGTLVYLSSIVDEIKISRFLLEPLTKLNAFDNMNAETMVRQINLHTQTLLANSAKDSLKKLSLHLFKGHCLFFFPSSNDCIAIDTAKWEDRAVESPQRENSILGPKDTFIENLKTNLSMIRRRMANENLIFEQYDIGTESHTATSLIYLEGVADEELIQSIRQKLQAIQVDVVLDSSKIAELLIDKSYLWTPFHLYQLTERPDKCVSALTEGRILILSDASPTGILLPVTVTSFTQSPDDYYFPSVVGTFVRLVRLAGVLLCVFLPALYISLSSVDQNVLRIKLMLAIAASREGVPYPVYIEVAIMMLLMELINEATIRLPKAVGQTATIVGGLIIGTAAAQSHLVSNIMIIITAAMAIGSYTNQDYTFALACRICSYVLVILAVPLGLMGMTLGAAYILLHLCHLQSFGTPYFAPYSTASYRNLISDSLLRIPAQFMKKRKSIYTPAGMKAGLSGFKDEEDRL
jgi:spore germination protein KA